MKTSLTTIIKKIVLFSFLTLVVFAQVNLKIKRIEFYGLKTISEKEVQFNMKLKEGDMFDEQIFTEDIKRLYNLGYFNKIEYEKELTKEGVILKLFFYENPVISKIEIKYGKHFSEKKLKSFLNISEGELLNENKLHQTKEKILEEYLKAGYTFAEVNYKVEIVNNKAKILFLIVEGYRVKVKKITFIGIKDIKPKQLKKVMKTKETSWLTSKYLNEKVLKEDLIRINSFLRGLGYLDATSHIKELQFSPLKDKVYITIFVELGECYKIKDIEFIGNTSFSKEQLLATIKSKKGDIFSTKKIEESDIPKMKELYGNNGYPEVVIQYLHKITDIPNELILSFNIKEGEKATVRKINISGNTKTKDKVIRRELLLYPGDVYNYRKIKESLQKLYGLRYFEDIKVENIPTGKKIW
jgi:outer membrane protein insertion porin family